MAGGFLVCVGAGLICGQEAGKATTESLAVTEWVKGAAIRLTGTDPTGDLQDMEALGAVIGDARIVAMGEETHGTREFFQLKHRMLEYLVEKKGFTIFAMEADWPESLSINEYVVNGTGDAQSALDQLYFWTWNTEEVKELVQWMRKYNEDPKHAKKIKFSGFDMQLAHVAARNVLNYLERVDPEQAKAAARVLAPVSDAEREKAAKARPGALWEGEEDRVRVLLRQFESEKAKYVQASSEEEWVIAQHNLEIVRQAVELYSIKKQGNVSPRDRAMAKNVKWILDQEGPSAKIMLWAHNGHVSAGMLGGGGAMGKELRRMYGQEMVVCGMSFGEGSFQAIQPGTGLRQFTVEKAPEDSVDGVLAATGIPLFAVDLRRVPANGAAAKWLSKPQKMRSIGAVYSEGLKNKAFTETTPRDFDVLFFVQRTTAARENPKQTQQR